MMGWIRPCWGALIGLLLFTTAAGAQQAPPAADGATPELSNPFQNLPGLDGMGDGLEGPGQRVSLDARFLIEAGGRDGRLELRAVLQPGWRIYSTTQPPGGPIRAEITVGESPDYEVTGPFEPDRDPRVKQDEAAFGDLPIEDFGGEVTWSAPLRLGDGVDPENVTIDVTLNGQVCAASGACELVQDQTAVARFAGTLPSPQATESAATQQQVTIGGFLEPKVAPPGRTVNLVLSATPVPPWFIYAHAPQDPGKVAKPTLIVLRKTSGWPFGPPQAPAEPKRKETGLPEEPVQHVHETPVTWTIPIEVPADAAPGTHTIAGSFGYQACSTEGACLAPAGLDFEAELTVGAEVAEGRIPLVFRATSYAEVAKAAELQGERESEPATVQENWLTAKSVPVILGLAFLAGLILNVMPCVLPVIGLKIMAFVQQAGGKRWEVLSLNLWFSLGLLFVFLILATLAAVFSQGWGAQFNSPWFTISMVTIVFAFGLAFLGVWHVPIPGFVSSGAMQDKAQQEGAVGAFSKGILTTLLATPCAGPMVIPLVSWSISQPPWLTYLLFTSMGVGMASPYLLVGAFPRLIGFLPRPGAWMNTVEQVLGFVLLGTAIFFFNSLVDELMVPTLVLLLGVGIACWWVGRTPATGAWRARLQAWGTGAAMIAFFAWFSFTFLLVNKETQLPWQPFSRVVLEEHLEEGRTVMVDFTADW